METLVEFKIALSDREPKPGWNRQLKSLWYDGKGDWQLAHQQVDQLGDRDSAWVHAYLHRKEGDIGNADYWYRRAGRQRPAVSLEEEWAELVEYFLHG